MKLLKKLLAVVLVVSTLACVAPMFTNTVEAASTKKVSTSITDTKLKNKKSYKKIPAIKTGKTVVTMKKQHSYVKFTAKKTKTYEITFSNVKKPKANGINGYIKISKLKTTTYGSTYLDTQKVKTYGGKTYNLEIANKKFLSGWKNTGKKIYYYKTSRTAKIKLKKGETIYIDGYFLGGSSAKTTYTVKIK